MALLERDGRPQLRRDRSNRHEKDQSRKHGETIPFRQLKPGSYDRNRQKRSTMLRRQMKVTVDRTKCERYAKCIQASPKVFKLDAKMIADVIDPKGDSDEKILLAAKICPTKAISLEEEGTGKKVFPVD